MKKLLAVIALLLCAGLISANAAEPKAFKLAFKDYRFDDPELRPMSVGLLTWTDTEHDCSVGGYFNWTIVSMLKDKLRLGAALAVIPSGITEYPAQIRFDTTVTTRLFDWLEVGAYYAPFWGLAKDLGDDPPWGVMVGYSFKL
jgi:hypothetical protein